MFTKAMLAGVGVAMLGITGCAGTVGQASAKFDLDPHNQPSLRVSSSTVVDSRVSPLVPMDLRAEDGSIQVRFAERGRVQTFARLDAASGQVQSVQTQGSSQEPAQATWTATRAQLDGGRFVVCWTEQGADGGRHVMARLWAADGQPLGASVAISPEDADVLGAPKAVSADGRHAVVTFASTSDRGFELRAVSLEDAKMASTGEQTAAR